MKRLTKTTDSGFSTRIAPSFMQNAGEAGMHKSLLKIGLAAVLVLLLACCGAAAAETPIHVDGTTFQPWESDNSLPTIDGSSYYLTHDVDLIDTWTISSGTINLCLNGYVINMTTDDKRVIMIENGATLNLYDCGTTPHYFIFVEDGQWTPIETPISPVDLVNFNLTEAKAAGEGKYHVKVTGGVITGGNAAGTAPAEKLGGGVCVNGGTFTMEGGNIVGNKVATSGKGGGVYVDGDKFTMNGGNIVGNSAPNGGGVYVSSGKFTMVGGDIIGNTVTSYGGGVYVTGSDSEFEMSDDANITGNTADSGGGVYVFSSGEFTMSGGSITGNTATGTYGGGGVFVVAGDSMFKMFGGIIKGNSATNGNGGGVCLYNLGMPTFEMTGGTIGGSGDDRNTAKDGGGVYVAGGTFDMSGTASTASIITGNKATQNGGGVYVTSGGTFRMTNADGSSTGSEASIIGNTATGTGEYGNGGGVYIKDIGSKFDMSSGSITKNTATNNGGGVYVTQNGEFTMTGGSITGNTAKDGGGVYIMYITKVGTFKVSGTPVISDNTKGTDAGEMPNNVYLRPDDKINVTAALEHGAKIWVNPSGGAELNTPFTSGWSAKAGSILPSSVFTADSVDYVAVRISNEVAFMDTNYAVCASGSVESSYYDSLNAAYSAASEGQTIIVLRDVTEIAQTEMTGDKSVTLDLNGKSITAGNAFADGLIKWDSTGKLTITDSETDGELNGSGKTRPLYINKGTVEMTGGKITDGNADYGGGVYVYRGTFTMCGGNIAGNTATNYGGGVYVDVGTFTMSDSAHITGNSATNGGGVYSQKTFTMEGGTIGGTGDEGNSATYGGGVYVCYDTFTMEGGSITGNKATDGGGVYVTQWGDPDIDTYGGTLNMSNGRIAENTATGNGGGVYVVNHGVFKVSGTPDISGNKKNTDVNNVYLTSGKKITIAGSGLTNNAKIGVTTQTLPAAGTPVDVTEKTSLLYSISSFTSDNPSYRVKDTTEGENRVVKLFVCHTVSFNANGHGTAPESQTVTEGEKVTKPTDPTADGYTFGGWFTDKACTTTYDFDKPVTADLTLYALWKANTQPSSSSSRNYGASIWLPATAEPTPTPTPAAEQTIPTLTPVKTPTQTPASTPAPAAGIIAGLAAAGLLAARMRK